MVCTCLSELSSFVPLDQACFVSLNSKMSKFPLSFFSWQISFHIKLFIFHESVYFWLLMISSFTQWYSDEVFFFLSFFSFSFFLFFFLIILLQLKPAFVSKYLVNFGDSFALRRWYIQLCMGEMFWNYLLGLFYLWLCLNPSFFGLVFFWMTCL